MTRYKHISHTSDDSLENHQEFYRIGKNGDEVSEGCDETADYTDYAAAELITKGGYYGAWKERRNEYININKNDDANDDDINDNNKYN